MQYLAKNARLDVALTSAVLEPKDAQIVRFKFMYLHGRLPIGFVDEKKDPAVFTQEETANIRANLESGGMLVVDAACNDVKSWQAFDRSFRKAMEKMFPGEDQKLQLIQPKTRDGKDERFFKIAADGGMVTLLQDGIRKVIDGLTDLKQVLAVCSR